MADEKPNRTLHTRDGVVEIPRSQQGVPLKEYLRNAALPEDIERSVVFVTEHGPVAAQPDPVAWGPEHDKAVADNADRLKAQIDERGYYSKTLGRMARQLSEQTAYPEDEMKAKIIGAFTRQHGQEPFAYLKTQREAQGLPVREQSENGPSRGLDYDREP